MTRKIKNILIENGDLFDGTPEQFEDCFFTNVDTYSIEKWSADNGWKCEITYE